MDETPAGTDDDRWSFVLAIAVAAGVVLPLLGAVGFFDPWETNYAEVARQMAVRDDYLYPFWKDAYFHSKPVLLFWLTAPLYKLLGADVAGGPLPALTELCGRLPSALSSIVAVAVVYVAAQRLWTRRAGFLSAVVLTTMTFWVFMARQAITDMLYVATSSAGLLLLAVALFEDRPDERRAPLPRWLLTLAALSLVPPLWEIGRSGAFLNRVALLGSESAARIVTSLLLAGGGAGLVWFLSRRARDPVLHLAALMFAWSMLAKGPVGLGLAGIAVLVTLALLGEWERLVQPAVLTCTALFLSVCAPWPVVMAAFDGLDEQRKTWFQRFVLYDLLGRVGGGAHGDRGTFEYYVRYAAYGMFPWSALAPPALFAALGAPLRTRAGRFTLLVAVWAVVTLVFFSATTTKFHHYIFPLCVPVALLIGRFLDGLLAEGSARAAPLLVVFVVLFTALIGRDLVTAPWELVDLFTYHYKGYKPDYYFPKDTSWRVGLSIACFGAAALVGTGAGLDMAKERMSSAARTFLGRITLERRGPNSAFVASALVAGVLFSVFAVQVYFNRASQHWSQRAIMATYFSMAKEGEPLIAYQMDWKGETFYTKNADIQVKKSGADLKKHIDRPGREFVIVQTDRFGGMKSAVGKEHEDFVRVVDRSNVKWYLVEIDDRAP